MDRELRVHITISPGMMRGILAAGLLASLSAPLGSESITLTTYYPAPVGIYQKMTTTGQTTLARDGGSVGIGTTNPSSSALLDLASISRGFLPPRMTGAQRDAIASPVEGLTVYDTTSKQLELYDGTSWKSAAGGSAPQAATHTCNFPGQPDDRCANTTYTNNSGKNRMVLIAPLGSSVGTFLQVNGLAVSQNAGFVVGLVPPNGTYGYFQGYNDRTGGWTEYDY